MLTKFFDSDRSSGRPDYFLLTIILIIVVFGLAMLSSASNDISFRDFGSTYHFFWRQVLRGFLPGLALFFFLSRVNYRFWERFSVLFFAISLILLVLVFIPGIGENYGRAQSWLKLGPLAFQPAETVKLLLILSLAGWFAYRGKERNQDFWNGLVPFVIFLGAIGLLIALQPDYGTLAIVAVIAFVIYFVAGGRLSHIIGLAIAGLGALGIAIVMAPYRAARLLAFFQPDLDPQGITYHISQALIGIGSGGWFGLGFGQSQQKFSYLPEVMGDSIFAVIAEELGFIVTTGLIILFLMFVWRSLRLVQATSDDYARLVVVGIMSWFVFQAFFNIAAMVGLMPLTGIPLPFISYGGTALATSLAAAGILINISRQT